VAFSEIFELEANPEEGQSLQHKDKRGGKGKAKIKRSLKMQATFSSKNSKF